MVENERGLDRCSDVVRQCGVVEQELQSSALHMVVDFPMKTENSYHAVMPEVKSSSMSQHFVAWLIGQITREDETRRGRL